MYQLHSLTQEGQPHCRKLTASSQMLWSIVAVSLTFSRTLRRSHFSGDCRLGPLEQQALTCLKTSCSAAFGATLEVSVTECWQRRGAHGTVRASDLSQTSLPFRPTPAGARLRSLQLFVSGPYDGARWHARRIQCTGKGAFCVSNQ